LKRYTVGNDLFIPHSLKNIMISMQKLKKTDTRLLTIAAFLLMTCFSCTCGTFASIPIMKGSADSQVTDISIENTNWQLLSYDNGNEQVTVAKGSKITLKFNRDGSIGGSGGINSYFGSCTMNGNEIRFGTIGCTLMAGPGPLMDQESAYFRLLDSARSFKISGTSLVMSDAEGRVLLKFRVDDAGAANGTGSMDPAKVLPGTEWQLSSYSDGISVVTGTNIRKITLVFPDTGNFSGFSGVNRYFGSYQVEGNTISIGLLSSTKMAGPEPLMSLESTYLNLLKSISGVRISGNSVSFTDSSGKVILTFDKKSQGPADAATAYPPTRLAHTVLKPCIPGSSETTLQDRFLKNYPLQSQNNWSCYSLIPSGTGSSIVITTGDSGRPSHMPRLNDTIVPPVWYPGGPLY
jgi:heat shock protein HslJ